MIQKYILQSINKNKPGYMNKEYKISKISKISKSASTR